MSDLNFVGVYNNKNCNASGMVKINGVGNITAGIELICKKMQEEAYDLCQCLYY